MRLSSTLLAAALLFIVTTSFSQEADTVKYWKTKLKFSINLNQSSFTSNWKGGGVNSIGMTSLFSLKANYAKDKISWDNECEFLYGFVNNQGQGFRKTLDRIYIDTKVGHKLNDKWDLFTSLNFLSQFAPGYNYKDDGTSDFVSDIFAPAYITSAWGVEYHPVDYFKLRLAPFSPRLTIVSDPERFVPIVSDTPYGVTPPDDTRMEWLAFQMLAEFNKEIAKNLNLKWRYTMYANYEDIELKTIDHRLDVFFSAKVNKFIDVGLGGILVYDYDQDPGAQINKLFTLGFVYNFQNFVEEEK
jgi:hypothetical protein